MKSLKKIYITMSVFAAVILIVVAWVGNSYIEKGHNKYLLNNKERSKVLEVLQQIDLHLRNTNSALEDLLVVPKENAYLDALYNALSQANITTSALIELGWETSNLIKDDLVELQDLESELEEFILLEFSSDTFEGSVDQLAENTVPIMEELLELVTSLEETVRVLVDHDLEQLAQTKNNLVKSIMVATFLGLLIILGVFVTTHIIVLNPLKKLTVALNKQAAGEESEELRMPRHVEMRHLIQAFTHMREQVQLRQAQLEHQAMHDDLTGLPNRALLVDRVNQLIKESNRNKVKPAVILLDMDRFKEINDTLGHHVGDSLLKEISRRLQGVLRDLDTIARLGGDEFAILLHNVDVKGANVVATKITNALAQPFQIENHQLLIRCSQGIAFYPEHGETEADLLKHADIAMYIAKRGYLGHCVYDPKENQHDVSHISLSADLTRAIEEDTLALYFQPKVDAKSGRVLATEALLRWNHPVKGFINPELIVQVAEQSGLIQPLTEWVVETAIKQTSQWHAMGMDMAVGVNLSVFNLRSPTLINNIQSLLQEFSFSANKLILEVTESSMMLNPELAAKVLNELNALGLYISIDDFGTGYSSLAYLKNLPVHELKIDRSFVMNIATDRSDIAIVKSTIDLAHNLGLSVVAEGVEDQESWDILNSLDCDIIQGYFVSRPIPVSDFPEWYTQYSQSLAEGQQKKAV